MPKTKKVKLEAGRLEAPRVRRSGTGRFSKAVAIKYPDHMANEIAESKAEFKPFHEIVGCTRESGAALFWPKMLESNPENCPIWVDPQSGMKCHAQIVQVKWLERAEVKRKGVIQESFKKQSYSPQAFQQALADKKSKLKESKSKLQEDWCDFDGTMGSFTGWPTTQAGINHLGIYLPFPPGPLTRQLYLNDQWRMISRAAEIYNHYGIAHGAVNILSAFVVGDGVGIEAEDKEAQEIWDEFEDRVKFQPRLYTQSIMLSKNGELLWHTPKVSVEGKPGFLDFISKDPGTCWEIITAPDDVRDVKAYYFNYPTRYMIVTKDNLPTTEYVVDFIAPNEIIHIKVNVEENEARGRSDLLSVMADMKMLQDIMRYRAIKVMNAAGIIIDRTIEGDDTDVQRVASLQAQTNGLGVEYTHNKSESIQVMKGADSERSKSGLHEEMSGQIGTGIGVAGDYISTGGTGSRAAALTRTEPAAKLFLARQIVFDTPIRDLFKKVIQEAKAAGRCGKDISEKCEVTFPEVAPENTKDKVAILNIGLQTRAISHQEYTAMYRTEIKRTSAYDYDELQAEIDKEKQGQLAFLYQSPQVDPDAGMVTDKPLGGGSPAGSASATSAGKDKSQNAYGGDKMGLSTDSRNSIKKSLQSAREAKKSGLEKRHKSIHAGLRSRTKHTLLASEESGSASMAGGLLRDGADNLERFMAEVESAKKNGLNEKTPPGFPAKLKAKIKAQYPGDDSTAFATMYAIRNLGYA